VNEHVEAISVRTGYTTFDTFASSPPAQYVVVEGAADLTDEVPLAEVLETIDARIRVKAVAGTVAGVRIMLRNIRAEFSPTRVGTPLVVAGRVARLVFVRSEFVDVDQDTTITGTNRHPAFGVDTYRLVSEPS
jgi:hypothetical protein